MDIKIQSQRAKIEQLKTVCEAVKSMPEPNVTKGYLETQIKIITDLWNVVDSNHTLIFEAFVETDRVKEKYFIDEVYKTIFDTYVKALTRIQNKLEKIRPAAIPNPEVKLPENVVINASKGKSNVKLKPIEIPTFSGDLKKWISFRSMFDSLIHNSTELYGLQKIHYLKSCLEGEAERMISQYNITEDDYEDAYKDLTDRYHNERKLVDTHLTTLISQPSLQQESGKGIKELLDVTNENLHALNKLKIDTTTWDPILLLLLVPKLDPVTNRLWELTLKPKVTPTRKEFLDFLETRFYALGCEQEFKISVDATSGNEQRRNNRKSFSVEQRYNNASRYKPSFQNHDFPPRIHQNFHNSSMPIQRKCPFRCQDAHDIAKCERFVNAEVRVRRDLVTCAKLCKNCLKGHRGMCSLQPSCQKCGKYHHNLLHFEGEVSTSSNQSSLIANETNSQDQQRLADNPQRTATHHAHLKNISNQGLGRNVDDCLAWDEPVLLATAIVLIRSQRDNCFYPFRALLDQASEANYISERAAQLLGLKKMNILASTTGLGGVKTGTIKSVADFELSSKVNPAFQIKVQAPVVPKVTNSLPSVRIQRSDWNHIKDLQLADPDFGVPGKIDVLLGAPVYGYLLTPGLIKASSNEPVAQNTEFGWILSGGTRSTRSVIPSIASYHLRVEVDEQLRKFFEQEEVSKERILTQEEVECEKIFKETVQRNSEGRYVVALPFKGDPKTLGTSKGQAISRLMKLETRFSSNKALKEEYSEILKEYELLGHTSALGVLGQSAETCSYYLPHHAVFKPESTTTKTRVVFDASARSTNGISLNDLLMTGPTLQQELSSILIRWRSHRIVFTADIAKMYRQVLVRESDRKYQKFIFRKDENEPMKEYQHNMVTFGVTSATYLAVRSLQQLAMDERENYPEASEIIMRDFYMDDGMSGADSVQEGIKLCKDLQEVLASGKFDLRKFISNSSELLESIPEKDRELKLPFEISNDNNVKTLGIWYHPITDTFQFRIKLESTTDWPTKRSLLSETTRLFDPLGWLAPVVIRAKIFFRELWQEGLEWDQKLPIHIKENWLNFRSNLHKLENIKIKRWTGQTKGSQRVELHGFGDASEKAYSAVVYVRVVNSDGSIQVTLLASKTRVAPLKPITLPCLELCAAVLLANLMSNVGKALGIERSKMYAWSDSTVVLGWLKTEPARLKTFVANRVVEAHNHLNVDQWHHIEGTNNPADCASRGISPEELEHHDLWWNGPDCLREHRSSWHQDLVIPPTVLELKKAVIKSHLVFAREESLDKYLKKYSDLTRLVRITAIQLRFLNNMRSPNNKILNPVLTVSELQLALNRLIRLYQEREFSREIRNLRAKENINPKSDIISLNPFLDEEGLLRVGGRLEESNLCYDRKHPKILSYGSLTELIIADAHLKTLHGGNKLTMNFIKESYWIINLKRKVKEHILNCVTCFRYKAVLSEQIMGVLPRARVVESSPFSFTGVDYAGPYNIKASNIRVPPVRIKATVVDGQIVKSIPKVPILKGYIALFVCFSTKAIHLEVVSDMTTDAFMAALKRFTSRRSSPMNIYSDNGTTFVGAKNVLSDEYEKSLVDYKTVANFLATKQTQWHFIPPKNPNHGGLWESGVKSMKHHLKRCIGSTTLTFEELTTITCQIEACLNSRPLCPLTNDPDDLSVLTPGHFLVGRPLIAPPSGNTDRTARNTLDRWKLQQKLLQDIWNAWRKDYLNQLQQRGKWRQQKNNLKVGDIVLLKEDEFPPTQWPLARIIEVFTSRDSNVRVARIRARINTDVGEYVRPINRLCLLPIIDNTQQ